MNSTAHVRPPVAAHPLTPKLGAFRRRPHARTCRTPFSGRSTRPFCATRCCCFHPLTCRRVVRSRWPRFGEVQVHVMDPLSTDGYPDSTSRTWTHMAGRTAGIRTRGRSWRYRRIVCAHHGTGHDHLWRGHAGSNYDMYEAYDRLDPAWKARIASLRAVHNLDFSRTRRWYGEDPMTDESGEPSLRGPSDKLARKVVPRGSRRVNPSGCRTTIEKFAVHPDPRTNTTGRRASVWDNRCVDRATSYDPLRRGA